MTFTVNWIYQIHVLACFLTLSKSDSPSDFAVDKSGLLADLSANPCATQWLNDSSFGWFASVNFPHGYAPGPTCDWIIDLGLLVQVVLRVKHIHLLSEDQLIVFDGPTNASQPLAIFNSDSVSTSNVRILSTTGSVLVRLISNTFLPPLSYPWIQYEVYGFNMTYQLRGICIPNEQRQCKSNPLHCFDVLTEACNGVWDCDEDGSDEWNCSSQCQGEGRYYCPKLTEKESQLIVGKRQLGIADCYTVSQRCDGFSHCPGMHDEKFCPESECGLHNGTWKCPSGECIYAMYRCDGVYGDCLDNGDETLCDKANDPLHSWRQSVPRPVIIATVIGSLISGVIVTITLAYVLHLKTRRVVARNREIFCNFNSPLQRLVEAELRRRQPPPRYDEAVALDGNNPTGGAGGQGGATGDAVMVMNMPLPPSLHFVPPPMGVVGVVTSEEQMTDSSEEQQQPSPGIATRLWIPRLVRGIVYVSSFLRPRRRHRHRRQHSSHTGEEEEEQEQQQHRSAEETPLPHSLSSSVNSAFSASASSCSLTFIEEPAGERPDEPLLFVSADDEAPLICDDVSLLQLSTPRV